MNKKRERSTRGDEPAREKTRNGGNRVALLMAPLFFEKCKACDS